MAKKDLLEQAKASGLIPEDALEDAYTADQLKDMLAGDVPAWEGSRSSMVPIIGPDGHPILSQEDIDSRGS